MTLADIRYQAINVQSEKKNETSCKERVSGADFHWLQLPTEPVSIAIVTEPCGNFSLFQFCDNIICEMFQFVQFSHVDHNCNIKKNISDK